MAEILDKFQALLAGRDRTKLALYSGHDTGPILPLLYAFGVADRSWPAYGSMIALELYEDPKRSKEAASHGVRMIYNGEVKVIPGCGGAPICPWESFLRVAEAVVPREGECSDPEMEEKLIHWVETLTEVGMEELGGGARAGGVPP